MERLGDGASFPVFLQVPQPPPHSTAPRTVSPHHRNPFTTGLVEEGVPEGQQGVPLVQGISYYVPVLGCQEPWLSPPCVQVGMRPKEWLVGSHLVPAHQQLWFWIFEEATNIRWRRAGEETS